MLVEAVRSLDGDPLALTPSADVSLTSGMGIGKVIADPRLGKMMDAKSAPFDGRRMIYGGFKSMVRLPGA